MEFTSPVTILGLPLIHIATGRPAKGVVAIGGVAVGPLAIGGAACGVIAIGGASAGVISFGGAAFGLLLAVGGGAVGLGLAIGSLAAASVAIGGLVVGIVGVGALAAAVFRYDAMCRSPEITDAVDHARHWLLSQSGAPFWVVLAAFSVISLYAWLRHGVISLRGAAGGQPFSGKSPPKPAKNADPRYVSFLPRVGWLCTAIVATLVVALCGALLMTTHLLQWIELLSA